MKCSSYPSYFYLSPFVYPQKKTFPNKRGPPSLQKEGNISDTVGGENHQEVVQDGEGEEEDKEKKLVR